MFQKLASLLNERSSDKKFLREAEQVKRLQAVWEEQGVRLFPENLHQHLLKHTRVIRLLRDEIIIAVDDTHTKNALALKQAEIKNIFEQETNVSYQAIRLKNQQV